MLEPDQSLKTRRSPVYPNWGWNDVDDLIDDSTTDSPWWGVENSICFSIRDVTRSQLKIPTMNSARRNLKQVIKS